MNEGSDDTAVPPGRLGERRARESTDDRPGTPPGRSVAGDRRRTEEAWTWETSNEH
jgi:hypothetical protein